MLGVDERGITLTFTNKTQENNENNENNENCSLVTPIYFLLRRSESEYKRYENTNIIIIIIELYFEVTQESY